MRIVDHNTLFHSPLSLPLSPSFSLSHDMIACFGETTGLSALQNMLHTMKESEEGTQILFDRPRINTTTVDIAALGSMPANTLGFHYKKFLDDNVSVRFLFIAMTVLSFHMHFCYTASDTRLTNACQIHQRSRVGICDDTIS